MPRRSAVELATLTPIRVQPERLRPPSGLSPRATEIFADLVASVDAKQFARSDAHLLSRYSEALALAEQAEMQLRAGAVVDGRPSPWNAVLEKAGRAVVALSARLRLSPQSRIDARAADRRSQASPLSAYDDLGWSR